LKKIIALLLILGVSPLFADAVSDLKEGRDFYTNAQYQQALSRVDAALAVNPYFREALLLRGKIYYKLQEPGKAEKIWNDLYKQDVSWIPVLSILGNLAAEKKDFDKSLEFYQKIIALDSLNQEARLQIAKIYTGKSMFAEAEPYLLEVKRANPLNSTLYFLYGDFYMKQGKNSLALENYLKSRDLNPDFPEVNARIAVLMKKNGAENAEEYYLNQAVDLDRANLDYYAGLARFYIGKKEWSRVQNIYAKIEPRFNDNSLFYYNYGVIEDLMGRTNSALQHLQRALQLNSEDPFIQMLYFNVLKRSRRSGADLSRKFARDFFKKGHEYYDAGNFREAVFHFRKGLMLDPGSEENRYLLAGSYKKLGYQKAYLRELKIACDLDPSKDTWAFQLERDLHKENLTMSGLKDIEKDSTPTKILIAPFEYSGADVRHLDGGLLLARELALYLNNYFRIDADVFENSGNDVRDHLSGYDCLVTGTFSEKGDSLRIGATLTTVYEMTPAGKYDETISDNGRVKVLLKNISRKIYSDTPFLGQIFRIDGNRIYVNLGRMHDAPGEGIYTVYRPLTPGVKFIPTKENTLGQLKIEQFLDDMFIGNPVDRSLLKTVRLYDKVAPSAPSEKKKP
jgi:tetratricopeptide (TPR) repeat protein